MKKYLIECLYNVRTRGGKVKTKKGEAGVELDATPDQLRTSKQLHISLGRTFQRNELNKVIAVEIKI